MEKKLFNDIYLTRCAFAMSQEVLTRRAGISRPTMSAIEHGKQTPFLTTALRIANELHGTVEDLFFLEKRIGRKQIRL